MDYTETEVYLTSNGRHIKKRKGNMTQLMVPKIFVSDILIVNYISDEDIMQIIPLRWHEIGGVFILNSKHNNLATF
jgi:hypothetical protein